MATAGAINNIGMTIMKRTTFWMVLFSLFLPVSATAENDYKCHVGLSSGNPRIMNHFADNPQHAKKQLLGKIFVKNNRRLKVNYVHECIRIRDSFSTSEGQMLDAITPQ